MRKVGFIISPGYQPMGFAVATPFEIANRQAAEPAYDIRMLSQHGGPVHTSLGFHVLTEPFADEPYDLIIVGASMQDASPETIEFIRHVRSYCRRIAATCLGAFVLAEAGLLDGRRATTHWMHAGELRARYPNVRVEEDRIFIADGPVWTSVGNAAGIDLALALIEEDLGLEAARDVARRLVLYHRRAGGQSQFSSLLALEPKSDRISDRAHLCSAQSCRPAERARSCRGRASLTAPVQSRLPDRNRPHTGEGGREPPPGGGARADGRHQPLH
jgi:transcriptional regulator GlxA family with amidase domain